MSDESGVYLHTIVVKVLSEDKNIAGLSLEDIGRQMDCGSFVGNYRVEHVQPLTRDQLEAHAAAMGSDASFFLDE